MERTIRWIGMVILTLGAVSVSVGPVPASNTADRPKFRIAQESFEGFKQQRRQGMKEQREEFQKYLEERSEAYQEFYEERKRKFRQFKKEIASKWGQYNVEVSTKKKMTSYSDDKTERSTVDLEEGKAEAEVVVDRETAEKNPEKVQEKLQDEVEEMVTKKSIEDEVAKVDTESKTAQPQTKEPPEQIQPKQDQFREKTQPEPSQEKSEKETEVNFDEPLLAGQVHTGDGEPVDEENAGQFAEESTTNEKVEKETVTGEDGEKRVKASVEIDLVSDHTEERARKYLDKVKSQADRFDVEPDVLLAVMHTESSFNPKARSHIPAYGLMQLVPGSGGKAAYKDIYGEEKVLKPDYLYNPENNIELGAGYLSLVYYQYFDDIENDRSRMYCAIASYNTGPGNLAKTFVDSMNVGKAEDVINTMTPEEVYEKLRQDLPYDETKKYIKKVRDRRQTYDKWLAQVSSA
jgi:membrane-bound lytic murein transglycosylase C